MSSPFPGMDPYLENRDLFADLHGGLIFCLQHKLSRQLPKTYYAASGTRAWIEVSDRYIGPDVNLLKHNQHPPISESNGGGIAVAQDVEVKPVVVHVPHDEIHETFLEIYTREGPRLVTAIEILSPTNKTPGDHGRKPYLKKQKEVLKSKVHLVEIDLLRAGKHTTAVDHRRAVAKAGSFDYHVSIRRFNEREDFLVYAIKLHNRLPNLEIPLLPGDPSVVVNLQEVFETAYEAGSYELRASYSERMPEPPLTAEQAEWTRSLLRDKGLSPSW